MRALITGASGFVGGHLFTHLAEAGDEVFVTDRATGGPDLCDPDGLRELLDEVRPEVIYHLAGQSDVGGSWDHPIETFRANAEGTYHLLLAAQHTGVERVVSVTSADVYGPVPTERLPVTEADQLTPLSPYAASKAAAEMVCVQMHRAHGLGVVRARAFNHLGPGQSTRFVAPALAARIVEAERSGTDVLAVGSLSARRDFTDVRDVVAAYRLLATSGQPGEAYNICSGVDVSIAELAELLLAHARRPLRLETDPALVRPIDLPVVRGDASKLAAATGWAPSIPLDRTLADLLDELRERAAT